MSDAENESESNIRTRPSSLLDTPHMEDKDLARLRNAVIDREGLVISIFELLRTVPRFVYHDGGMSRC